MIQHAKVYTVCTNSYKNKYQNSFHAGVDYKKVFGSFGLLPIFEAVGNVTKIFS